MPGWTIIVAERIGDAIDDIRRDGRVTKFNKCRLTGYLDGKPMRIVPRRNFQQRLVGLDVEVVIPHGFLPTESEKGWMKKTPAHHTNTPR